MNDTKEISYSIKGMDCAGCANTIETFCTKIKGIQNAEVNYAKSLLIIHVLNGSNAKEKLEKGVAALGFQLLKNDLPSSEHIEKSSCCTNHLEKKQKKTDIKNCSPLINNNDSHYHDNEHKKNIWLPIFIFSLAFVVALVIEYFAKTIGFAAFTALTLTGLFPVAKKAWIMAKVGYIFSVETLMTISAIGAIAIGSAEEAAAVIILFMLGETIEGYTARRARSGIQSLASLLPEQALLIKENGSRITIPTSDIQIDNLIEVKPSERIPVDGVIHTGMSYIDESLLTGESLPINKSVGEKVIAGSISTDGNIIIKATRLGIDNTVQKMIKMVEEAQGSKSRSMRSIEKFSRIYTPIVLLLGTLVAVLPPLLFSAPWIEWIYRGLTILLIGCPCALVISTPAAIASGITAATKLGILVKNASAIEIIGKVTKIAFDKTGTITYGHLKVKDIISFKNDENKLFQLIASVEEKSTHPLAKAILVDAQNKNISLLAVHNAKTIPGIGASAIINDQEVLVCSPVYAIQQGVLDTQQENQIRSTQLEGKTIAVVLLERNAIGFVSFSDELKSEAKNSILKLNKMGVRSVILTGDNKISTQAITSGLEAEIIAELLPEEKLSHIKNISKSEKIAMVGDGINDAPAIAAADIGIAMGAGTDVAVDTAQIVISRNNISAIVDTIELSRKTMKNIKQNITLSIGLKAIFLFLTIVGETQLWMAILADTGATVLVTLNAIRLLKYKGNKIKV
ncbi:heavy metal translocating P-type ATPase [Fluviispira multicolorata]|nr:heavy metal translocating P-type ATPase [Fluviispira multicolorata]